MSFFLYNQNGQQAIARPYLDGAPAAAEPGPSAAATPSNMPKYHTEDSWDGSTNAPSTNFVYDFDIYRFCVRDDWQEVFAHAADGAVQSGSIEGLTDAFAQGCAVKVGIRGLCDELTAPGEAPTDHEVFVQVGSCYDYTARKLFIAGTHPVVRVRPDIPLRYGSRIWDFGWLMLRTDGQAACRLCDPYTLRFRDTAERHAIRWFVR
jgi:hypothetical protein